MRERTKLILRIRFGGMLNLCYCPCVSFYLLWRNYTRENEPQVEVAILDFNTEFSSYNSLHFL
jgi:hypothetical protein